MNAKRMCVGLVSISLVLGSCDLLRGQPFEVVSWKPGEGFVADPGSAVVSLRFSKEPDRTSVETAFRFEADSAEQDGVFHWDGDRLAFTPSEPLASGRDYRVTLSASAEAEDGLSLGRDFVARFTTRAESTRPRVVSIEPGDGAVVDDTALPVVVTMSEAVDEASFVAAAAVSPSVDGRWEASADGRVMSFAPIGTWAYGERYEIRVGSGVRDLAGNALAEERRSSFDVGSDRAPPAVVSVAAKVPAGDAALALPPDDPNDATVLVTPGWEVDWGFVVRFSEPVSRSTALARIAVEPSLVLEAEPGDAFASEFAFTAPEKALRGREYALVVGAGIEDEAGNASKTSVFHRFRADGPKTAPPAVLELRFLTNPAEATPVWQSFAPDGALGALDVSRYPTAGGEVATALYVVLSLGLDQAPDLMAFRGAFKAEATNACATVSVKSVALADPATLDPPPPAGAAVIRVGIGFTNRVNPGLVTFVLGDSFADLRGTRMADAFRLPVLK